MLRLAGRRPGDASPSTLAVVSLSFERVRSSYTWPRWAFGAFKAFVARRIQLKTSTVVGRK